MWDLIVSVPDHCSSFYFGLSHMRPELGSNPQRKLSSIYVFSYFPFGFEGRIWDMIVSVPDHCLCFYFSYVFKEKNMFGLNC